jgi:adenosylcobinamide kinase / adenosylcobinamide-phosphate guanylyltransferase
MGRLIYLTGPVRSGKSRRAVELAHAWGPETVFVATYRASRDDAEMAERVRRHREQRPSWRTLEAPDHVAGALAEMKPAPGGAVLDCLTLWIGDRLADSDDVILTAWLEQLAQFRAAPWPVIVVGNEIGWSPVPELPVLRRFRDLAGTLGQQTAAAADEVWLMVAGCPLRLK